MAAHHKLAVLACVSVLVAGCATPPPAETMKAEIAGYQLPKGPPAGRALVYVVRPSAVGGLVRFNVFVDDQADSAEVGYTRGNQYLYFSLPPGEHKIYSKAENWADLVLTVNAGDIVFVQQEVAVGMLMARNSLSRLEDYQGRYYVKTLSEGTIHKPEILPLATAAAPALAVAAAPSSVPTKAASGAIAPFAGTWDGRWAGVRAHTLVVENADGTTTKITFSWGAGGRAGTSDSGSFSALAQVGDDGALHATLGDGSKVVYRLSGDRRSLTGQWQRKERTLDGLLVRRAP